MIYERTIRLIIASKIDDIALLSKAARGVCSTVIKDDIVLYHMELALVEAVTNVINHAYRRNPNHHVEVTITLNYDRVVFQIIDSGKKTSLPPPKSELAYDRDDLTTWPESGMGLF